LQEFLDEFSKKLVGHAIATIEKISPNLSKISFENLCGFVLEENGYDVIERNKHDGKGGDIDLVCTRDRIMNSPFESGEGKLFVQAKKHWEGTQSDSTAVNQLLKMMEKEPIAEGCVITLAKFTEDATKLAEENGIKTINGEEFCQLLLASIFG